MPRNWRLSRSDLEHAAPTRPRFLRRLWVRRPNRRCRPFELPSAGCGLRRRRRRFCKKGRWFRRCGLSVHGVLLSPNGSFGERRRPLPVKVLHCIGCATASAGARRTVLIAERRAHAAFEGEPARRAPTPCMTMARRGPRLASRRDAPPPGGTLGICPESWLTYTECLGGALGWSAWLIAALRCGSRMGNHRRSVGIGAARPRACV